MILSQVLLCTIFSIICVSGYIEMPDQTPVQGIINEAVTLPCTFERIPEKAITNAAVIWWKDTDAKTIIYQCERKDASTGNCSKSAGRYSLAGNPSQKNISLRISHVTHEDAGKYKCRIMLEDKIDWFTHLNGVELSIKFPQRLERIYLQTTVTGENWVTCEVSGHPLPKLSWVQPEDISNLSVLNNTSYLRALFSLSITPNTNYTCQIDGPNGAETQSKTFLVPLLPVCGESFVMDTKLIVGLAILVVASLVVVVLVLWNFFRKKDLSKELKNTDNVYHNYTNNPDIDGIYMNERRTSPSSK